MLCSIRHRGYGQLERDFGNLMEPLLGNKVQRMGIRSSSSPSLPSTGLDELKQQLSDDRASFAYVRVTYANDKESTRDKFVFIVSSLPVTSAQSRSSGP